jgi:hypothetical protein
MLPKNNQLTDISQLDELNRAVWAACVGATEINQHVKAKFGDIPPPSAEAVNEPESEVTETLPPLDKPAQ